MLAIRCYIYNSIKRKATCFGNKFYLLAFLIVFLCKTVYVKNPTFSLTFTQRDGTTERTEASLGRTVATYRFKAAGTCAISSWDLILDRSCCHNSSTKKVRSNPPQDIRLLQTWGHWTYIRAFRRVVWFSQLGFKLLKSWILPSGEGNIYFSANSASGGKISL
jgi:hypothetical protein